MEIDFRSDTLTAPNDEMRKAMATAVVGDDVFGEDPTVTQLERLVADLCGKEQGLFVTSGTQGNLIAAMIHAEGLFSELLIGSLSHVQNFEVGGSAILARAMIRQIPNNEDGTMDLSLLRAAVQTTNVHYTTTRAIFLENTHNMCGGTVLPMEYVQSVRALCDEKGLSLHCDGARIWNAAVALKLPVCTLLAPFDSASVCLSKALGAPVGSVLVGNQAFVTKARRLRKMLGGGLRQAGVLCAAGIHAVSIMSQRLQDDHDMASRLCHGVAALEYKCKLPQSNIVIWDVTSEKRSLFLERCKSQGLKLLGMGSAGLVRAIPHYGNTVEQVDDALNIIRSVRDSLK